MSKYAVIFDMDGVLVNNNPYHLDAWKLFANKYSLTATRNDFADRFGMTNDQYLPWLFGKDLTKAELSKYSEEKEEIYREIYANAIQPAEGLVSLLNDLIESGFALGVGTSALPSNLHFVLENTGLQKYFTATVDATMVKKGKPDPEVFLTAAKMLNVSPENALVFEDSIHGIDAALSAEMKVIGITSTFPKSKISHANRVIDSFTEIDAKFVMNVLRAL